MAIMVKFGWDGVTPEQYDELRQRVGWLNEPPVGGRVHVAAFDDSGVRAVDVWESAEDFQQFVEERLMPAVQVMGIPGQPTVEMLPLHELYVAKAESVFAT